MGSLRIPDRVKLIAGLLAASDTVLEEAVATLSERFGRIDASSTATDWTISTYYRDEMGEAIRRQFVSFELLIAPDEIATIKLATNALEERWRNASGRQVNIDPGYVATTKLVLASTKDAAHRIYLSHGIYAEVSLLFINGSFHQHDHTYPDYAAPDIVALLNHVRRIYLRQLRPD